MTQEENQLLLKDLCARLSYGIIYHRNDGANIKLKEIDINRGYLNYTDDIEKMETKPYLRPMSSMTEKEKDTFQGFIYPACNDPVSMIDWLNAHHFDYRGLLEKGLSLEAPEGMYKTE